MKGVIGVRVHVGSPARTNVGTGKNRFRCNSRLTGQFGAGPTVSWEISVSFLEIWSFDPLLLLLTGQDMLHQAISLLIVCAPQRTFLHQRSRA